MGSGPEQTGGSGNSGGWNSSASVVIEHEGWKPGAAEVPSLSSLEAGEGQRIWGKGASGEIRAASELGSGAEGPQQVGGAGKDRSSSGQDIVLASSVEVGTIDGQSLPEKRQAFSPSGEPRSSAEGAVTQGWLADSQT